MFMCQTCISCGLLVSTNSRTELLEEIPFFFHFHFLSMVFGGPHFNIVEVRRESSVLHQQSHWIYLRGKGSLLMGG